MPQPQEEVAYNGPLWGNGDVCPRILYNKKPGALKFGLEEEQVASNSSVESNSDIEDLKKRTIQSEQEYMKSAKRRRPTLRDSDEAKKLISIKLELAEIAKKELEDERERKRALDEARKKQEAADEDRRNQLFQLDKQKKEMEAKIAKLQYLKLLKELGMPLPEGDE